MRDLKIVFVDNTSIVIKNVIECTHNINNGNLFIVKKTKDNILIPRENVKMLGYVDSIEEGVSR